MANRDDDLRRRIESLEQRIARLEAGRELIDDGPGTAPAAGRPAGPVPPDVGAGVDLPPRSPHGAFERPAAPPPLEPPLTTHPPTGPAGPAPRPAHPPTAPALASRLADRKRRTAAGGRGDADVAPAPAPPVTPAAAARATPADRPSLEQLVGGRWMAWVGAIAVVAAVGFFLKLAYDSQWWGTLPIATRCVVGAVFGSLLVGAGEVARRWFGRAASVGLFGAGLSTLYLVAFIAFREDVLGQAASFVAMGLVALLGFGITLHSRFRTIGVLSILAGYATPVLLGGAGGHHVEVLSYLTMLLVISLGLSAALPRQFRSLRYVAFAAHAVVALLWLVGYGQGRAAMAIVFMAAWWAALLAECTYAAVRRQSTAGNIVATLLATAAFVTAGTWILSGATMVGGTGVGPFTAAVGILGAIVALQFGPGLDAMRGKLANAMDKLAVALWCQLGVLLVVAIAQQFSGYGASIGWLALAVGAVEIARRVPSRGVGVFGLLVGALAVARIYTFDMLALSSPTQPLVDLGSLSLTGWAPLGLAVVLAAHLAAWRLGMPAPRDDRFRPWRSVAPLVAGAGTIAWFLLWSAECSGTAVTAMWLAAPVVLLALSGIARPLRYLEIGLLALLVTAGRWLVVDAGSARLADTWSPAGPPVLTAQLGLAVAIAAVAAWAAFLLKSAWRRDDGTGGVPAAVQLVLLGAAALVLIGLSFELEREVTRLAGDGLAWPLNQARILWLTGLWAVAGAAAVLLGRARRLGLFAVTGAGVLFAASFAWLSIGTVAFRVGEGAALVTPFLNLQFAVGAACAALLAAGAWMLRGAARAGQPPDHLALARHREHATALAGMIVAVGLWLGSFELDRIFAGNSMGVHTALSIYWCLYGVGLIVLGFARRLAPLRYVGLALLTLTMGKVLFVDLAHLDQAWRVASFLVSGLLLIGTSIVYARLSPRPS